MILALLLNSHTITSILDIHSVLLSVHRSYDASGYRGPVQGFSDHGGYAAHAGSEHGPVSFTHAPIVYL